MMGTADQISALTADREKSHGVLKQRGLGWVYLAVGVILCCAFAVVTIMEMP